MEDQESMDAGLTAALRRVAEDDERLGASNAVAMRLLAEVHAIGQARRRRNIVLSLAAAAALFLGIAVVEWPRLALPQRAANRSVDAPIVSRELVTEFFPLAYSSVPAQGGYVVRMQVPRSALERFGAASFDRTNDSAPILADVVIGEDGLARAVRFVRLVNDDQLEQTP